MVSSFMSSIGARLVQIRGQKSQARFANEVGINKNTLGGYERNTRSPDATLLQKLMSAGYNANWLLTGEGAMLLKDQAGLEALAGEAQPRGEFSYVNRILVSASAGYGATVDQEVVGPRMAFQTAWLRKEGLNPLDLAVIEARGDSMEPTIHSGDALLVDIRSKDALGDGIYVIRIDDQLLVKRLQGDLRGGMIVKSDNPAYDNLVVLERDLVIAGKVVWIGHKL